MSFDTDPNESHVMSGADFAQMVDEMKRLKEVNGTLVNLLKEVVEPPPEGWTVVDAQGLFARCLTAIAKAERVTLSS